MLKQKTILILFVVCSFMACRKADDPVADNIRQILKTNLSREDFDNIDFGTFTKSSLASTHQQLVRVGFRQKNPVHDFVILNLNASGQLTGSKIVHIEGSIIKTDTQTKPSFNGHIETSSLKRENKSASVIVNGFVMSLHTAKVGTSAVGVNTACSDCTIPEVVVSSSYGGGGISWGAWMSLLSLFGGGDTNDYMLVDFTTVGGGGGGAAPPPVTTIDTEAPENKDAIDPKKYMDCFGAVPDNLATCSITISADLPVDGHPEVFFNWTDRFPGHAFIELNKSTPYSSVQQDIGFYPNTSFKVLTGSDIASKIADDGGHEYQARYTITVTPAQFQAAIDAINANSSNPYNVSHYNCTDFALAVFNAAGGGLTIPRHGVPGFEIDGGSNTPQGLYEKISSLRENGVAGTTTTNHKEYCGSSKGPCN